MTPYTGEVTPFSLKSLPPARRRVPFAAAFASGAGTSFALGLAVLPNRAISRVAKTGRRV
ncbi:hypothetical protein [Aureimonas sp. AU12]|uniref:hypothetical protein n=1 Tax=Aureimonas sp. AU12 TaxID=1638161 RepID=UPI000782AFB9|nr:hypothetical protein [Aureimonas sp. AU12]